MYDKKKEKMLSANQYPSLAVNSFNSQNKILFYNKCRGVPLELMDDVARVRNTK